MSVELLIAYLFAAIGATFAVTFAALFVRTCWRELVLGRRRRKHEARWLHVGPHDRERLP